MNHFANGRSHSRARSQCLSHCRLSACRSHHRIGSAAASSYIPARAFACDANSGDGSKCRVSCNKADKAELSPVSCPSLTFLPSGRQASNSAIGASGPWKRERSDGYEVQDGADHGTGVEDLVIAEYTRVGIRLLEGVDD